MKLPSIALALVLSAAAGAAVTAAAMPRAATLSGGSEIIQAGNRKPADCHRDVRTHRINGVKIQHRHVGENCAVRVVRTVTG